MSGRRIPLLVARGLRAALCILGAALISHAITAVALQQWDPGAWPAEARAITALMLAPAIGVLLWLAGDRDIWSTP